MATARDRVGRRLPRPAPRTPLHTACAAACGPNQRRGFGQIVIAIRKPRVSLATAPPSASTPKPTKAAQSASNSRTNTGTPTKASPSTNPPPSTATTSTPPSPGAPQPKSPPPAPSSSASNSTTPPSTASKSPADPHVPSAVGAALVAALFLVIPAFSNSSDLYPLPFFSRHPGVPAVFRRGGVPDPPVFRATNPLVASLLTSATHDAASTSAIPASPAGTQPPGQPKRTPPPRSPRHPSPRSLRIRLRHPGVCREPAPSQSNAITRLCPQLVEWSRRISPSSPSSLVRFQGLGLPRSQ